MGRPIYGHSARLQQHYSVTSVPLHVSSAIAGPSIDHQTEVVPLGPPSWNGRAARTPLNRSGLPGVSCRRDRPVAQAIVNGGDAVRHPDRAWVLMFGTLVAIFLTGLGLASALSMVMTVR